MLARRRRRWTPWIAAISLAVAAIYFVAAGFFLHRFATTILTVGPLAASLANDEVSEENPFALGYRGDPEAAFGLQYETVTLETSLGDMPAWFVLGGFAQDREGGDPDAGAGEQDLSGVGGGPSGVAALYVHGIAGTRENGYRHLTMLHEAGIPTLLMTYRNDPDAPRSQEGVYAFGLTEWRDVEVAAAALIERGYERLIIVGESMGGGITGQFLERSELADHVTAVALDSPALDFQAVLSHLADRSGLPFPGGVSWTARHMISLLGPIDMRAADVVDVIAAFDGPLFLAHGRDDRIVPATISDTLLAERTGATVSLRTDADHLQSWHADPDAYRQAFGAFLDLLE